MGDTPVTAQTDNGPQQINTPPYPGTTKIENGQAYDISGKALGAVDDNGVAVSSAQKPSIDYDALAKQAGSVGSALSPGTRIDYDALAKKTGSISTAPPSKTTVDYDALAKQSGSVGSVSSPTPVQPTAEQPGILERAGKNFEKGLGLPTSEEDLHAVGEANKLSMRNLPSIALGPAYDAITGLWGYAQRVAGNVYNDAKEEYEAGHNIVEGGPIGENVGKAAYAVAHGAVVNLPFVGEPAEALAEGVETGNYAGAAGSAAAILAQTVLPEVIHGYIKAHPSAAKVRLGVLSSATREHMAVDAIHKTAVGEVDIATAQVAEARHRADMAAENETAGQGTRQQTVDAQNNLSEASANLKRTQAAVNDAAVAKAEAAVKVSQAHRDIENAAKPKTKVPKAATPEEIAKSNEDFSGAIPSGPGKSAYTPEDRAAVRPLLENSHLTDAPIDTPEAVFDSMQGHQVRIEIELKPWVEKYANEPLKLDDAAGEPVSVKQKLVEALVEDEKVRPGFTEAALKELDKYNTTDMSVGEADRLRKALNDENRATLQKDRMDVATARATNPEFAARYELADIVRNGVYDRFIDKGVLKARELRQLEASIIRIKNAADRMIPKTDVKMRGTGEAGPVRKAGAWIAKKAGIGAGAAVGGATGIPGGAEVGAISGGMAGEAVAGILAPGDLTRGQRLQRSMKIRQTDAQVPHLDVSGAQPSNPPAFSLPPEVAPPVNPRENTQLHSDMATHYGEQMGETPYPELEDRFLSDVQIKKKFKVPLDPSERKLLQGINEAKVEEVLKARGESEAQLKAAEKAKTEADRVAAEAEKEKAEKEAAGLKTNLASPFETEPHLSPEDERSLHHELGHHFQIAKAGHPTHDIIGRLHDQIDRGAEAEARWDPSALLDDKGKLDLGKLRDNIEDVMDIFHGGPVADEVMNGTPVHKNAGAKSDLRRARTKLIEAGFAPTEASQIMAASEARVRKDFTQPGIRDIFQRYAQAREAGLDDGLLMSEETSGRAIQEFKDALEGTNETTNESTTPGKGGRGNTKSKPGGTSGVSGKRAGEGGVASTPGEGTGGGGERGLRVNLKDENTPKITDIIPELKGHPEIEQKIKDLGFENVLQKEYVRQHQTPKPEAVPETKIKPGVVEKTTGSAEDDSAIKAGGGIPGGVMDFGEFGKVRMFHDPESGTTLGFKNGEEVTPEAVKAKIDESRKQYEAGQK